MMLKPKQTRWQSIPSWSIIALCTSAGVLFALLVNWHTIIPAQPLLTQLPPLPIDAVAIHSFELKGFFRAVPHIQAADGKVYDWISGKEWISQPSPLAEVSGDPCTPESIALIGASAAPVIDCQVVRTIGEWCPGTLVSIAVTEGGDVWELTEESVCLFFFGLYATVFGPAGFALGVILVVLRKIVFAVLKRLPASGNG